MAIDGGERAVAGLFHDPRPLRVFHFQVYLFLNVPTGRCHKMHIHNG